jgi:predicted P-loop ATPase
MLRNRPSKFTSNLANVVTALLQAPAFAGCVAYDEMGREVQLRQPLPGHPLTAPRRWTDEDTSRVQDMLQRDFQMSRVSHDVVQHGVNVVARRHAYHPVRDWLDTLAWDGTKRLETWLTDYAGAADTAYTRAVGRMFLISMIARVQRPGCKVDYELILEGPQGSLKSQLLRELAQPWFSDQLPDLHHKDASQHLRGLWLIEMAELDTLLHSEITTLKAFLTRTEEKYRPPWGRNEVTEPRQCVFAGTTNFATYLRDPTGGRRFWCVATGATGALKPHLLRRDRGQLLAEALVWFRAGKHWWPARDFEIAHIQDEQETRYVGDIWQDEIEQELPRLQTLNAAGSHYEITVRQLATSALLFETSRVSPRDQQRIALILQRLGWRSKANHGRRWWEKAVSP